jgi:hypothetical protein
MFRLRICARLICCFHGLGVLQEVNRLVRSGINARGQKSRRILAMAENLC